MASSKAVVLKRAIARVDKIQRQLVANVRLVLDARIVPCADDCPGWFSGEGGPERCDHCARLNGYQSVIHDGTIGILPEAIGPEGK